MKMSDYFDTQFNFEEFLVENDIDEGAVLVFHYDTVEWRAVFQAIQQHDALVEALTEIQADANATPSKHAYALCVIRQKANALLEQIKNDK